MDIEAAKMSKGKEVSTAAATAAPTAESVTNPAATGTTSSATTADNMIPDSAAVDTTTSSTASVTCTEATVEKAREESYDKTAEAPPSLISTDAHTTRTHIGDDNDDINSANRGELFSNESGEDIDWGTIDVYTCTASCSASNTPIAAAVDRGTTRSNMSAYLEEYVIMQPPISLRVSKSSGGATSK
jgi:hypothetical protein